MPSPSHKIYLPGLNTVRFAAAMAVFYIHYLAYAHPTWHPFHGDRSGGDAVTVFFVLSGYLITYRLLCEVRETGTIDLRGFYLRRIWRIWPLYYALVIVSGFLIPALGGPPVSAIPLVTVILMVPEYALARGYAMGTLTHLWSIGVEEVFYLTFPYLMTRLRLSVPRLCFGVILISITVHTAATVIDSPFVQLFSLLRVECMAVGALAAWAVVSQSPWLRLLYHRVTEGAAILLLALLVLSNLAIPLYELVLSIVVAVFLLNISTNPHALTRLEWGWSKAAGDLTYSIYIWHYPIVWAWSTLTGGILFLGLSLVTTLAAAWVSYHLIERPIMRLRSPR